MLKWHIINQAKAWKESHLRQQKIRHKLRPATYSHLRSVQLMKASPRKCCSWLLANVLQKQIIHQKASVDS